MKTIAVPVCVCVAILMDCSGLKRPAKPKAAAVAPQQPQDAPGRSRRRGQPQRPLEPAKPPEKHAFGEGVAVGDLTFTIVGVKSGGLMARSKSSPAAVGWPEESSIRNPVPSSSPVPCWVGVRSPPSKGVACVRFGARTIGGRCASAPPTGCAGGRATVFSSAFPVKPGSAPRR